MKMIEGARLRASANRSRTRDAPTPTNISTKLEPVTEKNGTSASPATARASSVLPVPGGPTISTPRGTTAPGPRVALGVAQEVDDLADLRLGAVVTGDVGEAGRRPLLVEDLGRGPADAEDALQRPAAPRDSRRQNQKNSTNGARMMIQFSSSVPNPADEGPPVTLTPSATSWSRA